MRLCGKKRQYHTGQIHHDFEKRVMDMKKIDMNTLWSRDGILFLKPDSVSLEETIENIL